MANTEMTLPEIFVQLPEEIQAALESALERSTLPLDPTKSEIFVATEVVVFDLKYRFPMASQRVVELLDMVPQAVANLLS